MQKLIYILSILLFTISSCKKTDLEQSNTPVVRPQGTLLFHLHTYIAHSIVNSYNTTYTTHEGRKIALSKAQFYLSDIRLVKADNSEYAVSGVNFLKTFESDTYTVGKIPVGNYKAIKFKVGLNASDNALEPSTNEALLNHSDMWFDKNAQPNGYVFMNIQGSVDTSANLNKPLVSFSYQIGTSANYTEVQLSAKNFSILENQSEYAHIMIDYSQIFNDVSISNADNLKVLTPADNGSAVAKKISANISKMFKYE